VLRSIRGNLYGMNSSCGNERTGDGLPWQCFTILVLTLETFVPCLFLLLRKKEPFNSGL